MTGTGPARALILDVDGVVSPIRPLASTAGRDEVDVGSMFGPVLVSRIVAARLERLSGVADVQCWWLTSWTAEMRARMRDPFPGRDWPAITEPDPRAVGRTWWKLAAVEAWLAAHGEVRAVAWCDDHLRGRVPVVRRRLTALGVDVLAVVPEPRVGLIGADLDRLEAWASDGPAARHQR